MPVMFYMNSSEHSNNHESCKTVTVAYFVGSNVTHLNTVSLHHWLRVTLPTVKQVHTESIYFVSHGYFKIAGGPVILTNLVRRCIVALNIAIDNVISDF